MLNPRQNQINGVSGKNALNRFLVDISPRLSHNGIRMTKLARVISCIFLAGIFLFAAQKSLADFLIRPVPEIPQPLPVSNLPTPYSLTGLPPVNSHSLTFGDLLNSTSTSDAIPATASSGIATPSGSVRQFIDLLNSLYTNPDNQHSPAPADLKLQPGTDIPTPFIPIPTLIESVNEITSFTQPPVTDYLFPTPTPTDYPLPTFTPLPVYITPTPGLQNFISPNIPKSTYTVALLGDSMTDTLGKDLPQLKNLLHQNFPSYSFALLNYGQGSTNIESGLYRLTNTTNYLGRSYPPLLSYKPDILVVESFAYNHWGPEESDLNRQWIDIAKIIDTVRENSPATKIILASSIAPNASIFGDGALNWNSDQKWTAAQTVKSYLQNLTNFATSQHFPLADAYHPSLGTDGNGIPTYINNGDHLHPSDEGKTLYSQKIVDAIKENNIIQ